MKKFESVKITVSVQLEPKEGFSTKWIETVHSLEEVNKLMIEQQEKYQHANWVDFSIEKENPKEGISYPEWFREEEIKYEQSQKAEAF